jgi:hypothetical protein
MRATTGNARDHRSNDPIYLEYLADLAKEQAAIKAEQDALAAADEAADPELQFKRAADAEAQTVLELLKTGFVPESILPIERLNGRVIANEQAMINNWRFFAENTPSFKPDYMGRPLLDAAFRSQIIPTAPAYTALHNLMLQYGAYPEPPAQPVVTETVVEVPPVLSRSEQAVIDHQRYCDEIIGHDESGKGWTMQEVDALPSKEMLRLLRLFEQGHRGSNLLTIRREILDLKQQQDAERERIAAEQNGGN